MANNKNTKKIVSKAKRKTKKEIKKAVKNQDSKKILAFVFIFLLIVVAAFVLYKMGYLDGFINSSNTDSKDPSINDVVPTEAQYSDFQIHFLELGNANTGDCIYIKAGENDILIDAGSKRNSATTIKNYLDHYVTDHKLEYVIVTHAHEDHIASMVGTGNNGVLYEYQVDTLIDFARTDSSSVLYQNYVTAVEYAVGNGTVHYTAKQCFDETDGAKRTYNLGENMKFEVLYNAYYDAKASTENDYSVVTLFTYKDTKYLFTGDLEEAGEKKMVQYYQENGGLDHVNLFKAGHHGSYTASNDSLLSLITPDICVVTCVAGSSEYTSNVNNQFPSQAFISRISKYTNNVYVTSVYDESSSTKYSSMNGTIIVSSDGTNVGVKCSNNQTLLKDTVWFQENRKWE